MKRTCGLGIYHIRPLDGVLYTGQQCLSVEERAINRRWVWQWMSGMRRGGGSRGGFRKGIRRRKSGAGAVRVWTWAWYEGSEGNVSRSRRRGCVIGARAARNRSEAIVSYFWVLYGVGEYSARRKTTERSWNGKTRREKLPSRPGTMYGSWTVEGTAGI